MKNHFFTLIAIVLFAFSAHSQDVYIELGIKGVVNKKISKDLVEGTKFESLKLVSTPATGSSSTSKIITLTADNGKLFHFEYNKNFVKDLSFDMSQNYFWKSKALSENVYTNIMENGIQYDIRNALDEDCIDYIKFLESNGSFLNDDYIKDYLQSIFLKIYPESLNDGRTSQLDIRVLKTNEPYAAILANGTALISLGILNMANSEDELTAVLAHEAAHFVLDHHVQNINAEIKRQKRGEFWASVATLAVASAATYAAIQDDIYFNPSLIANTAVIASAISSEIVERVGMKYSREQEMKADECAADLLTHIGYNKDALGSILAKMRNYYYLTGNFKVFTDNGTHPNINYRIEKLGVPKTQYADTEYDVKISNLLTMGAYYEYYSSHFQTSETLIRRNIKSGAATEEDYILMALVNLAQYNTQEKYRESLEYLQKAKTLNVNPDYQANKIEALVYLRMDDKNAAKKSLNLYSEALQNDIASIDPAWLSSNNWNDVNSRLNDEMVWTRKMLFKLSN